MTSGTQEKTVEIPAQRQPIESIKQLMTTDPKIAEGMAFFEKVYPEYKNPDGPSWEEMRPRIEKYLVHLYNLNLPKEDA